MRSAATLSDGLITFSGQRGVLDVETAGPQGRRWTEELSQGSAEPGYIYPDTPYVEEMRDFLAAVAARDPGLFPNNFARDERVLSLLNDLEDLSP